MQVYLDNNATTRTSAEAVAAMLPYFTEHFGNAASSHGFGAAVSPALRAARRQVQSLLGAAFEQEIMFCSGGTEANNSAIHAALAAQPGRDEIITSAVEHPAIMRPLAWAQKTRGITVRYVPVDAQGRLDMAAYRAALGARTALVSFMWANNETGTIFPVSELAAMAHAAGALFHTDAVQAAGKIRLDVKDTHIDLLSISAHKLHGPKGIGALYIRKGTKFQPLLLGGGQERGRRAGTENVPAIVGFGAAAAQVETGAWSRMAMLRDVFESRCRAAIPATRVNGDIASRLPNTSNISFEDADGEAILHHLAAAGIAASLGSACSSGSMEPSHVLLAMGVPLNALHGALRFSLSRETAAVEIDHLLALLPGIVARVRAQSPLWAERQSLNFA
ncbi:MAG TPA: cysteine desulfurase NifS [Acidocella sp.]|jgi:cysteine desulfurase|nr:cysteine desulfurase NifS [Acidocella sp.]